MDLAVCVILNLYVTFVRFHLGDPLNLEIYKDIEVPHILGDLLNVFN